MSSAPGFIVVFPVLCQMAPVVEGFGSTPTVNRVDVVESILPPMINEFAADQSRDRVLFDLDGDPSDWIELSNLNSFAVDVADTD